MTGRTTPLAWWWAINTPGLLILTLLHLHAAELERRAAYLRDRGNR